MALVYPSLELAGINMSPSPLNAFGMTPKARVDIAIADILIGRPVILVDDERENEGDLIIAAEKATAENINFLIRYGSGIICLALTEERTRELDLPLMTGSQNEAGPFSSSFTVSIEAKHGISTGVSARDRATTILAAVNENAKPMDFCRPGHIFPLRAKKGGLLERHGHTEGSIEIVKMAGLKPAAALCELMNSDGSVAQIEDSILFAREHALTVLSIRDLISLQ